MKITRGTTKHKKKDIGNITRCQNMLPKNPLITVVL